MTAQTDVFSIKPLKRRIITSDFLSTADLRALLRPETDLERHLLTLPEFQRGLTWGEPRFGHPEGKIVLHVREVLENIECIENLTDTMRRQLRLIALTHDTFKYAEARTRPRDWSKHHSLLARRFLERYTNDTAVLDVVETHDDAYYAWLAHKSETFRHENPEKNLEHLRNKIGYCLQLYYLFFKCDTQTGDKLQAPVRWFEQNMPGIQPVPIREGIW
ncbi:MAG: HD domain-containing protein [Saprospiraceae bacterium]|nr:HD domain-containing protein [Saprospiraceae bacterium]MDW8231023.1 HD domain-containing protein [Saprospiraceae bacterium]